MKINILSCWHRQALSKANKVGSGTCIDNALVILVAYVRRRTPDCDRTAAYVQAGPSFSGRTHRSIKQGLVKGWLAFVSFRPVQGCLLLRYVTLRYGAG